MVDDGLRPRLGLRQGGGGTCDDATITDNLATPSTIDVAAGGTYTCTGISSATCAQLNNADSGLTNAQRQLIQRVNTLKTGQTTSYRTGDDGDLQKGRGAGFDQLDCNNPFGNTNRFTDQSGTQTYADDIVVDWLTGLMWYRIRTTSVSWNTAIDDSLSATTGGYSDWYLPNINQLLAIASSGATAWLNFSPFGLSVNSTANSLWTSTTRLAATTQVQILSVNGTLSTVDKTGSRGYIYCRNFTYSGGSFS